MGFYVLLILIALLKRITIVLQFNNLRLNLCDQY